MALADWQILIWIISSNKSFINNNISVCRLNKTTIRRIRNKSKHYFIIDNIWKQLWNLFPKNYYINIYYIKRHQKITVKVRRDLLAENTAVSNLSYDFKYTQKSVLEVIFWKKLFSSRHNQWNNTYKWFIKVYFFSFNYIMVNKQIRNKLPQILSGNATINLYL